MKESQRKAIEKHGKNLNVIFKTGIDPVTLCKKLRRLELKAERAAENLCNGTELEESEAKMESVKKSLKKIIGTEHGLRVFINRDPRGYALKIDDEDMREKALSLHMDLGGYGILAPEIN